MLIFPEAKLITAGQFSEEGVLLPTELARQAAPSSVQPRPVLPVSRSRSRRQLFAPKQFNGAYQLKGAYHVSFRRGFICRHYRHGTY
jgi:hypothetical protein